MKIITRSEQEYLDEAVQVFRKAKKIAALTGAGISVESGIDDFRSPGGLWSKYPVEEFGTIDVFKKDPKKAWKLFRMLGRGLSGKKPNTAHRVLAELESLGLLQGIVTQNIDNLHQSAGSETVVEIHGDHFHLQCIGCGDLIGFDESVIEDDSLPRCRHCDQVLKPNVVLFGEAARCLDDISFLLHRCDLLMVIGTSAQVYPAASLPVQVKEMGGVIYEFNKDETVLTKGEMPGGTMSDFFFNGSAGTMLSLFLGQLKRN
jgi:NAD-dependent deacetylase